MREVHALAAGQHACLTTAQLTAAGIGRATIARRVADGAFRHMHRGVYLVGPFEPPLARVSAALLAVPGSVLSHETAAALYELVPADDGPVHVTTTSRGPRSRAGIRVHATESLPPLDVRVRHDLRLTSPERTLLDLAAVGHPQLARVVEEAHVRGLVSTTALRSALAHRRGRAGAAVLAAILGAHAPSLTRSEAERRLLELVRAASLPPPRTNVRVGRFEVDFLWPRHRVIVEVDGFAFHSSRAAFERDRARDAELQAQGYRVIRVTWRQLEAEPHVVVARLAAALALAAA